MRLGRLEKDSEDSTKEPIVKLLPKRDCDMSVGKNLHLIDTS